MSDLSVGSVLLVAVASVFTAAAAAWDLRTRRIPNWLTLPVFAAGWIYQGVDRGWTGLADAGLGFLVGFGILFVLWVVGGGGGGDVKLMGALSVWLGLRLTMLVLIASTVLVICITLVVTAVAMVRGGFKRQQLSAEERRQRRLVPFAIPVALATWIVIAWKLPTLDNPVRGQAASHAAVTRDAATR